MDANQVFINSIREERMLSRRTGLRALLGGTAAALGALMLAGAPVAAQEGVPLEVRLAVALTGPPAANGKQALRRAKIWDETVNKKGGLLGSTVPLVYYDDQSSPSTVPGIYTKLLDVDKVELVVGPYATAQIAPAMPVII